jgi:helix-turn-helix protein
MRSVKRISIQRVLGVSEGEVNAVIEAMVGTGHARVEENGRIWMAPNKVIDALLELVVNGHVQAVYNG